MRVVLEILQNLNSGKATILDQLSPRFIKDGADITMSPLTHFKFIFGKRYNFWWSNISKIDSYLLSAFSTDTCLVYLTDYIKQEKDKCDYVSRVLLNLQKAFDIVNHGILIQKLKALGLD